MTVDRDKLEFYSGDSTDKIIGVYTGSLTMSAASSFTDSYAATALTTGISGKVLPQMIWSTDNGVTWQDGDAQNSVYSGGTLQYYYIVSCYATDSDIFVVYDNIGFAAAAPSRSFIYKVFAFSVD